MLYLVACDHDKAQTYREGTKLNGPENKTRKEFRELLIKTIEEYDPALIAEEHHPEFLKRNRLKSIALEVASERRICHRFCEPSISERRKLGIDEELPFFSPHTPGDWSDRIGTIQESYRHDFAHRWPIREEFWIAQLGEDIQKKALFICGAGHRETLRKRLETRGVEVKIIAKRFGAARMRESDFAVYREIRRNGFPPASGCFCSTPPALDTDLA